MFYKVKVKLMWFTVYGVRMGGELADPSEPGSYQLSVGSRQFAANLKNKQGDKVHGLRFGVHGARLRRKLTRVVGT
jgi:hypothetical protein